MTAFDITAKHYVPAGSYQIERQTPHRLTAILSTCVGVALYDREAGVGGILHILLPEPTGTSTEWQPLNYATTGLPLFLDDLVKAGAEQPRLEAVVAGGALYHPTRRDMELDIGGRTTEAVFTFLRDHRIPVVASETGGCHGAVLKLHTGNWQASIEPLINPEPQRQTFRKPTAKELDKAIQRISPIPQIALKIIRLVREEQYQLKDLTPEIWLDQVIAAKVLRLCNSPFVGASKYIDSIDRALLVLGENLFMQVILSSAMDTFYTQQEGGYALMRGGLYRHSFCVAQVAKTIAQFTGKEEPATAYTAGLLHDIGKIVLDQYFARFFPLFYHDNQEVRDFVEIERQALGIDHQRIGRKLAEQWNLPPNLAESIQLHHQPHKATVAPELTHIVYLADLLTSWFLAGMERERVNVKSLRRRLERLGLQPAQLEVIVEKVPWNQMAYV